MLRRKVTTANMHVNGAPVKEPKLTKSNNLL